LLAPQNKTAPNSVTQHSPPTPEQHQTDNTPCLLLFEMEENKEQSVSVSEDGLSVTGSHSRSVSEASGRLSLASDASRQSRTVIDRLFGRRAKLESQLHRAKNSVRQLERKITVKEAVIKELEDIVANEAQTPKTKTKAKKRLKDAQFSLVQLQAALAEKEKEVVDLTAEIDRKDVQVEKQEARVISLVHSVGDYVASNPEFGDMNDFQGILSLYGVHRLWKSRMSTNTHKRVFAEGPSTGQSDALISGRD
jgi:small-conductance mechanosensitive channel